VPQDAECFICKCSINSVPRSSEGIVRGCACRGTAGLAHVACLVRQAQIEAKHDNPGRGALWTQWYACRLCGQYHRNEVQIALAWHAWQTYAFSDDPQLYNICMLLGNALSKAGSYEQAITLLKTQLELCGGGSTKAMGICDNIATCYIQTGNVEKGLELKRVSYNNCVTILGPTNERTLSIAAGLGEALGKYGKPKEAKIFLREKLPLIRSTLGDDHHVSILACGHLVRALCTDGSNCEFRADETLEDIKQRTADVAECTEAIKRKTELSRDMLEALQLVHEFIPISERVFGVDNPWHRLNMLHAGCMVRALMTERGFPDVFRDEEQPAT